MFESGLVLVIIYVAIILCKDPIEEFAKTLGWEPPEDKPCVMVQPSDIIAAEFEKPWWEGGPDPR